MERDEETTINRMMEIVTIEGRFHDDWKYDNNTTLLLMLKDGLAGMLKATLEVTGDLQKTQQINAIGLVQALSEFLTGIMDNMELVGKDGVNHGFWRK